MEPPRLGLLDGAFVLSSAGEHFVLEADGYGATLAPLDPEGAAPAYATEQPLLERGMLRADDRLVRCEWPQEGLVAARTGDSIAVVSPVSYGVKVFARALS